MADSSTSKVDLSAPAGSSSSGNAESKPTAQAAVELANCLALCSRQFQASLPEITTVRQLWELSKAFSFQYSPDGRADATNANSDMLSCSNLVGPVLQLLTTLQPQLSGVSAFPKSSSSRSSSLGSIFSGMFSRPATSNTASSKAGVDLGAAPTHNHPNPADQDPFPDVLLYSLASIMHLLDQLFKLLDTRGFDHCNPAPIVKRAAILSRTLFCNGKLVESIFSVILFLLRYVRQTPPLQPTSGSARSSSSKAARQAACHAVCNATTNRMFGAIYILAQPEPVMAKITTRFFQALGCLVCEGLPEDNESAWRIALLQQDASLLELTEDNPLSLLCCPAMQLLSRRALTSAVKRQHDDLEAVFDMFKAFHMQLDLDDLLSDYIRPSSRWPMRVSERHMPPDLTSGVRTLETSDAYFVPRVKDTSLQEFIALLPKKQLVTVRSRSAPLCATKASIITARITAALLSLQGLDTPARSPTSHQINKSVLQLSDSNMQDLLLHVAAYTSVLANQLLRGLRTKHVGCAKFELMHLGGIFEEGWEEVPSARSASRRECVPCSALAEGFTAVMLQLLRLHVSPDARRVETLTFQENMQRLRPQTMLLDFWLGITGVSVALEAGVRHMGSSEPATSFLRGEALRLIIIDTGVLKQTWSGMLQGPMAGRLPSNSLERSAKSPFISLYMTLFKSFMLELHEGSYVEKPFSPIPPNRILDLIGRFLRFCRSVWEGKGLVASSGREGFVGSRSHCGNPASQSQAWLRLVLIMLRSWVLIWVEVADRETGPNAYSVHEISTIQGGLVSEFRHECNIGASSVLMEAVLEACGLNNAAQRRQRGSMSGGHARWERFAFKHLEGKTLPGCSNWGCTNLKGFSEAALPTLLCSGCKRARYCSIACQREAWVKGEHKDACGKVVLGHNRK